MAIKPILFNTEMVRAILDGRKDATRRIVKGFIPDDAVWGYTAFTPKGYISCRGTFADGYGEKFFKLPCEPGDILYVRETFAWCPCWDCGLDIEPGRCSNATAKIYKEGEYGCYMYRASCEDNEYPSADTWHPSIHMPKEAARIWLKVTDVRVERLQEISEDGAKAEGANFKNGKNVGVEEKMNRTAIERFVEIWNSTIKKADLDRYGWNANPYVWVIEFERCEKPAESPYAWNDAIHKLTKGV